MLPDAGWAASAMKTLLHGAHAIVLGGAEIGIEGRLVGFEMRDTIAVISPACVRFAFLFRKPIIENTVAAQILKTGTGGLDIDVCRIGTTKDVPGTVAKNTSGLGGFGIRPKRTGKSESDSGHNPNIGRWPPNLAFVHGPECKTGLIVAWECEQGCPVKMLDAQSGDVGCQGGDIVVTHSGMGFRGGRGAARSVPRDVGGASRFYPQFKDDAELLVWFKKLIHASETLERGTREQP